MGSKSERNLSARSAKRQRARCRVLGMQTLESRQLLTAVVMTQQEQLLLELVNRARANPVAEASRFGIDLNFELEPDEISPDAKQPLAPHQALRDAARGHSIDMLDREFFEHENPDGKGPSDRARAAGYPAGAGENIAWFGTPDKLKNVTELQRTAEVYRRHEALFLSPPHRTNMMTASYRELGTSVEYAITGSLVETDPAEGFLEFESIVVTENFGNRGGDYFITGVIYTDNVVTDNFFSVGEAIGNATVTATRNRDGEVFTTTSGPAGGYGLQVPTGVYVVSATSPSFPAGMTVSNVVVLSENIKVDFNRRVPAVGSISGTLFDDQDRDGVRDTGEGPLVGHSVYLDANEDGKQNPDETVVVSNSSGRYSFPHLRKGAYQVRQVVDAGWEETAPTSGVRPVVLRAGQSVSAVGFGKIQVNQAPIARDDSATTESGFPVSIDAFANDGDFDGTLAIDQTQVFEAPQHGQVALNSQTGRLIYTPDAGFVGTDTFAYGVTDDIGLVSEPATVTVTVTPEVLAQWQNERNHLDVNNDAFVSSIDALLVLNSITIEGTRRLAFPNDDLAPPPYFDVNGDGFISPIDALLVLNEINRIAAERRELPQTPVPARAVDRRLIAAAVDIVFEPQRQGALSRELLR